MSITVTPGGTITLCKTKLENDYKNTFTFATISDQQTYFTGLTGNKSYSEYTYMKKDGKIRLAEPIDNIIDYNYCYYNNGGFSAKRYYCFITRMEYVNENCTDVYIETDVMQTWYFSIVWNRCFVEREHVSNDTIGDHTVPEGLETGEYICNDSGDVSAHLDDAPYIIMGCTWLPSDTPFYTNNRMFGKVFSGLNYILFKNTDSAAKFVQALDDIGHDSGKTIVCMFELPLAYLGTTYDSITWSTGSLGNQTGIEFVVVPNSIVNTIDSSVSITQPSTLNGYSPRNNKLFTYPYNFLTITNNAGASDEYHYEDFVSNSAAFTIKGVMCPSGSGMMYPINYKKDSTTDSGYQWGLPLAKFPMGSWNSDAYTNWLTQNSINISASLASGATSVVLGGAMAAGGLGVGGTGSIVGGITSIANTLGQVYQHASVPRSISGQVNSGDMALANSKMSPTYYKMSVRYEYAAIIDSYFDMFGYKVNSVKVPNITGRTNWNFIKTIDCNVDGDIPQEDLDTIKKACNSGITFWHTPANIYNYSLTNSIVS